MIEYKLKHENAQDPVRGSNQAAGFDLHAAEILRDNEREFWVDTGVAFGIPDGIYGDLRARSSVSETGLILANGAGVVDPDYTGTIQFRFYKVGTTAQNREVRRGYVHTQTYDVGDRVGQIIFNAFYRGQLTEVMGVLKKTERGEGGFGSTGT